MGTYVFYYLGDEYGLRARFLADLPLFTSWFRSRAAEYPDEYPPGQLQKLLDIGQRGTAAFRPELKEEAHLIDRLVDEYWHYCDENGLHRNVEITPSAHKWNRYAENLFEVLPSSSAIANSLYKRLFQGRSLAECSGHEYQSEDGLFRVSWLLPAEVQQFLDELQHFEGHLNREEDAATGVLWLLKSLKQAGGKGVSLVIAIA